MAQFVLITTILFVSYLFYMNNSLYIIDNGENIRIISLSSDCNIGRVEFYNGTIWGTLTDCNQTFKTEHANLICKSLGFEFEQQYFRGSIHFNQNITKNPFIAYTQFDECQTVSTYDVCNDCFIQNNIHQCNNNNNTNNNDDLHKEYDIFVMCDNYGLNKQSSKYQCILYDQDSENIDNIEYESCDNNQLYFDDNNNNKNNENGQESKKIIMTIVAIAIFGSILCVILFACYSKYNDTKRLSASNYSTTTNISSPIGQIKNRNSGFSTVPTQGLELPTIHKNGDNNNKNNDGYIPPPQPMFIYHTRQVENDNDHYNDHDELNINNDGYDMEEIIPSVIYSNNKSASESYGLIKNHDDDDEDDEDDEDDDDDDQLDQDVDNVDDTQQDINDI